VYSRTVLAVPRWLNYYCIMQILPLLCQQRSLLLIETVRCTTTLRMFTVTLYNFSCGNGNGHKNFLGPCNRDVLHQRLHEDSDKIPEGRTSTHILHLSGVLIQKELISDFDASTNRPQPVFILSIKSSLNDFIPDK
jgi:hypothetical protein